MKTTYIACHFPKYVLIVFVIHILSSKAERAPWDPKPWDPKSPVTVEDVVETDPHASDTGQSTPENYTSDKDIDNMSSWHEATFDHASKRWLCPDHSDPIPTLENQDDQNGSNDSIGSNRESQSVEETIEDETGPQNSFLLSLENARYLDNIYDRDLYQNVFFNLTGLNITLPPAKPNGAFFRSPSLRGKPVEASFAVCQPELTTVKIDMEEDPNFFYWPACTRVERCGGCCSHELLSCHPVLTENVPMTFMKLRNVPGGNPQVIGNVVVQVPRHKRCVCDCRIKKEDCNAVQFYSQRECRCICKNDGAEEKCKRDSSHRYWDSNSCRCRCRLVTECSTGLLFDHNTCGCTIQEADVLKPLTPEK